MSARFYDWLARKYGGCPEWFEEQDEDFREKLIAEYSSICASYGY